MNENITTIEILGNRPIYALGNTDLLEETLISVSGARKITPQSASWLEEVVSKSKAPIVSGLAIGTDTIAHETAIENNVPTIAVLPSGLKKITPYRNSGLARRIVKEGGLLLSEYPGLNGPTRSSYIERNEIIAKLGKYLIVPQFESRSGTRHTVDFAQENNKFIFVQDANYSGNQEIIGRDDYKTVILD